MQLIKPISISGGQPTNLPPLLFIMFVSMVKDFVEDRARRKSDAKENDAAVEKMTFSQIGDVRTTSYVTTTWKDLKVGDIVKVKKD